MTDFTEYEGAAARPEPNDAVGEKLRAQILAEPPSDYEAAMANVPLLPGWVRLVGMGVAGLGSWALVIAGLRALIR
jgi:hypothetical protein